MFKAQSYISGIRTLADRSIRLTVDCQEMPPDAEAELFKLRNTPGWFAFKESDVEAFVLPDEPAEFAGQKSLSERLRNALFVLHQKKGGKPEDFELFRKQQMERIIQYVKDLIEKYDH